LGERLHPRADGAVRVTDVLKDRVPLSVQPAYLLDAQLVNLIRRHRRRGRCLEGPPIEVCASRPRRDAGIVGGRSALRLQLGELPLERRRDRLPDDRPGALLPVARDIRRAPLDRLDQGAA